ncbi:MAG TPA: competence protein, partial [Flavobacteriaceae bacterium]|nr:competence protein [Flavobacteriaceae bacterium]
MLKSSLAGTLLLISLVLFALFYFKLHKKIIQHYYFTAISFLVFTLIGVASVSFKNDSTKKNHYTSHISNTKNNTVLIIDEVLKPNNYYNNYIAHIVKLNNKPTFGKIKLNIQKDSTKKSFAIDDKIIVFENFKAIKEPLNPYGFNYKNYLSRKQIHHQITLNNNSFLALNKTKTSLKGLAYTFREKIILSLKNNGFKDDELAIINALLLGKRQEISKEIIQNYQNAGAIHILAVSGLHVGI